MVELELDAVKKLEAAKLSPQESFSDVVRRARFPQKPHTALDLLQEFQTRSSPLSEEALDRLTEAQRNPQTSPSHWVRTDVVRHDFPHRLRTRGQAPEARRRARVPFGKS
ncbi:MAG: hypothetical protein AB1705_02815 [Verrucomicrobiota bacterium]